METKPEASEIIEVLGKLVSCWSIPASDDKHEINLNKPAIEAERAWLDGLDVLRRYHA